MTPIDKSREDAAFIAAVRAELDKDLLRIEAQLGDRLDAMRDLSMQQQRRTRSSDEETLVQIARDSLGDSGTLGSEIEHSLDLIRQQALSRLPARDKSGFAVPSRASRWLQNFSLQTWRVPAGVVASFFVLTVSLSLFDSDNSVENHGNEPELSLIASADEIELYENLEFYLWLSDSEFATQ